MLTTVFKIFFFLFIYTEILIESHADRPPTDEYLFDALYDAIDVLGKRDSTLNKELLAMFADMDRERFNIDKLGEVGFSMLFFYLLLFLFQATKKKKEENLTPRVPLLCCFFFFLLFFIYYITQAGCTGIIIRAIVAGEAEGDGSTEEEKERLLRYCKFLRECVHHKYWARVVAHEGGLVLAMQVIAKHLDGADEGQDQQSLDLIRVCVHLLADACVGDSVNSAHVFTLHAVRIIHDLLIRFR